MRRAIHTIVLLLLFCWTSANAEIRVVSWNISEDAFEAEAREFQALIRWADPDVVLLDEVSPTADIEKLRDALDRIHPDTDQSWHISRGESGGRQRGVIASRASQEHVPEFSDVVPYPGDEKDLITKLMGDDSRNSSWSMDGGIPINAAIIETDNKRLLVVITDLQCCGGGPDSWQEHRRRIEAAEIRRRVVMVLERTNVDGIIIGGDFNVVNGLAPLDILSGPYPHLGQLEQAAMQQADGATWTWDGRGTPFPSGTLDFQLHSAGRLDQQSGVILNTEQTAREILDQQGLEPKSSRYTGRHRPLVGVYRWQNIDYE